MYSAHSIHGKFCAYQMCSAANNIDSFYIAFLALLSPHKNYDNSIAAESLHVYKQSVIIPYENIPQREALRDISVCYFVPKIRSPASPSPGMIYAWSLSFSSTAAK